MRDHGTDTPVSVGNIVDGIASVPITVGEGQQPLDELVNPNLDAGRHGPCGDAYDNLVVDFGFTPLYSIGNRVFADDDYDMHQDDNEAGLQGFPLYAFAADEEGRPTGGPLAYAVTDADGWYRLDGLVRGTYVVVLDREAAVAANPGLAVYTSTIGTTNDMTLAGDRWDHGWYHLRTNIGPVTNGYSSSPVTLGPGMQPVGEQTGGTAAGAQSPYGDDRDNLVLDFGMVRTFCIGNRVFLDDGSGGGTANDGIQNGTEPGIPNAAVRIFAADASGNPTGNALVIGTDNLSAALTNPDGWYRFFRLAPGDYVVVVDVGLSTNLTGFVFKDGSTWVDPAATSTSLVGMVSSAGYSSDLTLTGDRRDHGKDAPVSVGCVTYGIAGPKITLGPGLQPLGEQTNSVSGPSAHSPTGDAYDNLVMDFGFAPTFSIGNRIFWDNGAGGGTAGNGVRDGGEPGIAGVRVEVRSNGTTLATTVTDAEGYYRFDNLLTGEYTVFLPPSNFSLSGALSGMLSSTNTTAGENGDKGIDNNHPATNGIESGKVTIGFGAQPAGETDTGTGAGANSPFGDNYDNLTIDFGMIEVNSVNCSAGSLVWNDANNNGRHDAGESGIAGVTLEIWKADPDGDLIGPAPLQATTTAADGTYLFNDIEPGLYRIRIPETMFASGGPLEIINTASTLYSAADDQIDNDSNGAQSAAGQAVLGPLFQLSRGGEPEDGTVPNEFGPGATQDNQSPRLDDNGDMTMDFGFYAPTLAQTNLVSLGSLVWSDLNNNGMWDSGEPGIPGVTLELYITNATGLVYWGTTQSAADGTYFFRDLVDNTNWVVRIPAPNFAPGGALYSTPLSSGTPVNADNQADSDNNALQPGGFGAEVWSPVIALTAGNEPTNESGLGGNQDSASPYIDANGDMTLDFGFTPVYSLGNRVFADLDNNGVMDAGESGIGGVPLLLFAADASGNPTGAALATTVTDNAGWYRFDDLIAGSYVVVADVANADALAHWVSSTGVSSDVSLAGDGRDHGYDTPVSVGTVVNGIASVAVEVGMDDIVLPTGEAVGEEGAGANGTNGDAADNLTLDFGFTAVASVSGCVIEDVNANGIINPEDTNRLAGVTVNLTTPCGAVQATTVTDSLGRYSFTDLAPGDYAVTIVGLPGWYATGDAGGGNDRRVAVTLASGENQTGVDFLEARPGMIGGTVWNDLDADGDFSEVDMTHGIEGVTVSLKTNGVVVATTTTMADGRYIFNNVVPGSYDIVQSDLPGWSSTADSDGGDANRIAVSLPSGGQSSDNNFLDYTTASISGRVLVDVNGNGQVDAEDVNGISGVTVKLLDADNNQVGQQVTGADGAFTFTNLLPGSYTLVETDPAGYVSTSANQLSVTVTSGQESRGHAFLDTRNGNIGDFVWEDLNGDGVQDSGEPGLSNVVVRLLDVHGVEVASTLTDANGMYLFSEHLPGAYVLDVAAPAGYVPTRYQQGDDPALDNDINPLTGLSDLVMLTAGQTNLTADAGFVVPAVVRGYAFIDTVSDLLRDTGDTTVTNLLVRLVVDGKVFASTNTDATGYYEFGAVPPGVVSVLVSRVGADLVDVPAEGDAAYGDERRNRAVTAGEDAVIVHTVTSGDGVLRPAETLNFGFITHPMSTAIDIRLYVTPEGVMIQLWTVNEAGCGDIVIYAWIDNAWVEVGRVPAWLVVGEGANAYTVAANGLAAGGAYYLRVIDEVGNEHLSLTPVAVGTLEVDAVRLDLQHVTLRFNTEPGRRYQIEVSTDLVTWRTEYVSAPTATGWTAFATEPFMAGPGAYTEVRAPRNGRSRAFFKIRCIE